MRTRSKVTALAVATMTIAAVMTVATPALAAGDTINGGCFADVVNDQTAGFNADNNGVIGDVSVTRDSSGPVFATVTCFIEVNTTAAPGTRITASGNGVQVGQAEIVFAAGPTDVVQLCQDVVFADGFDTGTICRPEVNFVRAPQLIPPVNRLFPDLIDPLLCPALGGDLIVLGVVVYDCPPYNV